MQKQYQDLEYRHITGGMKHCTVWREPVPATVFPQAIGLAAAFDAEMMKEIGSVIATEGRAKYNENPEIWRQGYL